MLRELNTGLFNLSDTTVHPLVHPQKGVAALSEKQNLHSEQIDFGTVIHCTLDSLNLVIGPFHKTIAQIGDHRITDCINIAAQTGGE